MEQADVVFRQNADGIEIKPNWAPSLFLSRTAEAELRDWLNHRERNAVSAPVEIELPASTYP